MFEHVKIQELSGKILLCQFDPLINDRAVELYIDLFKAHGFKVLSSREIARKLGAKNV